MKSDTDRIEKSVLLRASPDRVWQAITDAKQFGTWFGVEFEEAFAPGAYIKGKIVPTKVDHEVAKMQDPFSGAECDVMVERMEPMSLFSFRWHPGAPEPGTDLSKEPTTLVTFELKEHPEGTMLTITESGFDAIPLDRRAEVFKGNEQGWQIQTTLIGKYLDRAAGATA
jgi:uncharacterized protein YndB with AHSA1/START domain